jgi:hypothetical protein
MRVGPIVYCIANSEEFKVVQRRPIGAMSQSYVCGGCGKPVHGRVVVTAAYASEDGEIKGDTYWCFCPCGQPTVIQVEISPYNKNYQYPTAIEFRSGQNWPTELDQLFKEAAASFSANAYTACAMVCRKILMAVACKEGDSDGKKFTEYVDYIVTKVIPISTAKSSIDRIRQIGNEANHNITFVSEPDARRAIEIARYVLNAAYSLPAA